MNNIIDVKERNTYILEIDGPFNIKFEKSDDKKNWDVLHDNAILAHNRHIKYKQDKFKPKSFETNYRCNDNSYERIAIDCIGFKYLRVCHIGTIDEVMSINLEEDVLANSNKGFKFTKE